MTKGWSNPPFLNYFSRTVVIRLAERFRQDKNLAKIFGIILYTESHSNIIKVLKDDDYWNGFHEDSKGWIVFSHKPVRGTWIYPSFPSGTIGAMIPIWEEPQENLKLLDLFELESTKELPLFVIFNLKSKDKIERVSYKLKDDSLDNARNSIQDIINTITDTVNRIMPEYQNTNAVYREVEKTVESKVTFEEVKNVVKIYAWIKGVI